jgi:perosamine synthetase
MTNISAAIGLAQLEQADEFISKKQQIALWYNEGLNDVPVIPHKPVGDVFHTYWMYSILVGEYDTRDNLRKYLRENGIDTRPTFYPVHTMPMYANGYDKFEVAEYLGWQGINLPSYPSLKKEDITYITQKIKDFYK